MWVSTSVISSFEPEPNSKYNLFGPDALD